MALRWAAFALLASQQVAATRSMRQQDDTDDAQEPQLMEGSGGSCAQYFGRCGGPRHTGPTCCMDGAKCVRGDDNSIESGAVSRCLPDDDDLMITDPTTIDTLRLSLVDTTAALAKGTLSSETLTVAFLAQIEAFEADLNAFTFLAEFALSKARTSDRLRRAGLERGALEGVPVVVKEALDVLGLPSTLGWNATAFDAGGVDLFPLQNADAVQALLDAGAVLLGKTNIPVFSTSGTSANSSWDGPTFNAVNRALVPGGSSSGTATAVAAGFAVWGVGEETGGSIQNPSAAQSLVGIKPTLGLVPTRGLAPLSPYDVIGPIAKTVRDAALALDALTRAGTPAATGAAPAGGYGALIGKKTLSGSTLGLFGDGWTPEDPDLAAFYRPLEGEPLALYETALESIESLGATLVEDPFAGSGFDNISFAVPDDTFLFDIQAFVKGLGVPSLEALADMVGPGEFTPLLGVAAENVTSLFAAIPDERPSLEVIERRRVRYLEIVDDVFEEFGLDALVFPQALNVLPLLDSTGFIESSSSPIINVAGLPVVTVPGPRADPQAGGPTPWSLAFLGPQNSEATLLALAHDYEQATRHRIVPELERDMAASMG